MNACQQVPFVLSGSRLANGTQAYPLFELMDSIVFERPYTLNGLYLTSSVFPDGSLAAGVIVVFGQNQPVVRLTPSVRVLAAHLARGAGLSTNFDRGSRLDFNAWPLRIAAGEPIGLYVSGVHLALTQAFATCNLHLVPR